MSEEEIKELREKIDELSKQVLEIQAELFILLQKYNKDYTQFFMKSLSDALNPKEPEFMRLHILHEILSTYYVLKQKEAEGK